MAENTRQYEAIVTLKGNIEAFTPEDAFVAGDHLIYVDSHDPAVCQAPDVYVAFGRPRGHRGSYKLWGEDNVFPQVVFEVLGPSNTESEMRAKREFYFKYGAEEYYEFDPEAGTWLGLIRNVDTGVPEQVAEMDGHTSPLLGMKFGFRPIDLVVYRPDGSRFLSFQELNDRVVAERQRAETERARAETERARAESQRAQAETERARAEAERKRAEAERERANQAQTQAEQQLLEINRLRDLLRAAGLNPDQPPG
jgi:Uma2 family endonuclease